MVYGVTKSVGGEAAGRRPRSQLEGFSLRRLSGDDFVTIVDKDPNGILVLDDSGTMLYANPAAKQMLGSENLEEAPFGRPVASGKAAEIEVARPYGPPILVGMRTVPIRLDEGPGMLVRLTDITETRRLEEERDRVHRQSEELDAQRRLARLQHEFLNLAAHEFNTPLQPILINAKLLDARAQQHADQDGWKDIRDDVATIRRNAERLRGLVKDIVDVSGVRLFGARTYQQPVDLSAIVDRALKLIATEAAELNVQVRKNITPGLAIKGNKQQLVRLVDQLLDNAVRYANGPKGRIMVKLVDRGDRITLSVKDNGPGVAPELLSKIFQPFYKDELPPGEHRKSSGLGLYIAREVAEGHGGRVWAETNGTAPGATFYASFPKVDEAGQAEIL